MSPSCDADGGRERIGPGRLILVVGPSGAGKDTLIDRARLLLRSDDGVVFARRVVTRESSAFEDNEIITAPQFAEAVTTGGFALHWQAHDLCYGLKRTINDDIQAGRVVVANVSRAIVATARAAYATVTVVLVTAPPAVLATRLAARSRASDGPLAKRLARAAPDIAPDATISNVGRVEDHAAQLVELIRGSR